MSRAFVKETAESAPPPERMVDEGPNLVTPEGLAQIDAHIARIEASMKIETNVLLRETLARDLRYWEIRKSTAEVVTPSTDGTVAFGSSVTIQRKGRTQTFRIVGPALNQAANIILYLAQLHCSRYVPTVWTPFLETTNRWSQRISSLKSAAINPR